MANEVRLRQFQLDLDSCCGLAVKVSRRLTGLEKRELAGVDPIDAIDEEYGEVFGGKRG